MLAKLTLRQEDMLNQMALDRSFLLFLQAGKGSILPEMILADKEWHHQTLCKVLFWYACHVLWLKRPLKAGFE